MPAPELLRAKSLEDFKTLKVKHPRQEETEQFLRQAIDSHRSYTLLDLYGASGVGKSTVIEHVAREVRRASTNPAVFPVVIVSASPEDVGFSARLDYYQQILGQLQHYSAIRDRTKNLQLYTNPGKKSNDPAEWLEMRNAVEYALALLQVKVVFVDEAQHLLAADSARKPTAQLDWLKALTNRTNVLHVLVGNFDLYECCHLSGQVVRRMRDQHYPRYHLDNAQECKEFAGALKSLLECAPMTVDVPMLLARWRWFLEWSMGCVGIMGDWIVETVDALHREGSTVLTLPALTRYALQPDQRARLEMEARLGENRVARARARSEQELQRFLAAPVLDSPTTEANPAFEAVERSDRQPKGRRIERAARRDPVGDQVPRANPDKCPFSGVVPIPLSRFLESGVALVECPDCGRAWTLSPSGGVLRFKSHDKRKMTTPNTGRRWARGERETDWDVVGGSTFPLR